MVPWAHTDGTRRPRSPTRGRGDARMWAGWAHLPEEPSGTVAGCRVRGPRRPRAGSMGTGGRTTLGRWPHTIYDRLGARHGAWARGVQPRPSDQPDRPRG